MNYTDHPHYRDLFVQILTGMNLPVVYKDITESSLEDLVCYLLSFRNDPELPFHLVNSIPLTAHGPISMGLVTAPTVRDLLDFMFRFYQLATSEVHIRTDSSGPDYAIYFQSYLSDPEARLFSSDLFLLVINNYLVKMTGHSRVMRSIATPRTDAERLHLLRRHICTNVVAGSTETILMVDRNILDYKSQWADSVSFRKAWQQCEQEEQKLQQLPDLLHAIAVLVQQNPQRHFRVTEMAQYLGLSVAQLRYGLKKNGTHLTEVIDTEKCRHAKRLLQSGCRVSDIGIQIGFNSPANFSLAFKRWTGMSPREWRQHQQNS